MITSYLPDEFFTKLAAIGKKRNFNPEDSLAVMLFESGVNGKSIHPIAPASGIFGKMFKTREEAIDFTKQNEVKQLDAYDAYMAPYTNVPKPTAANLYQLNFLPASAIPGQAAYRGTDPTTVLAAKNGTGYGGNEASYYKENAILDRDKNGSITVQDLGDALDFRKRQAGVKWTELAQRIRATGAVSDTPIQSSSSNLIPITIVALLAGGGTFLLGKRKS